MKLLYIWFLMNYHQSDQHLIDLHMPDMRPHRASSFDVKIVMRGQNIPNLQPYYFQGELASFSRLTLRGRFVFPIRWGQVSLSIQLPPIR